MEVPDERFLGVDPAELRGIGCVTVAAARLEYTIRSMSVDVYRAPGMKQANELLSDIGRAARAGLPRHAGVSVGDVLGWVDRARSAMQERHGPSHSAAARRGDHPVMVHLRSGEIRPMEAPALMEVAHRISSVDSAGGVVQRGLRHSPRPGVFLPNAVVDGQWIPTCDASIGGADMARPTDEELDRWWTELGPFPSLEE